MAVAKGGRPTVVGLEEEVIMYRTSPSYHTDCRDASEGLLAEIHRRIGSNIECEALNLLASMPGCLEPFWFSLTPALDARAVHVAANELRRTSSQSIRDGIRLPDHLARLSECGYSREDRRQVQYVVEAFYNLEPVFAVLAAAALEWLAGGTGGTARPLPAARFEPTCPAFSGRISLADEDEVRALGVRGCGEERSIHPLYRALAVWPRYLCKVCEDLSSEANRHTCAEAAAALARTMEFLPVRPLARSASVPLEVDVDRAIGLIRRCLAASFDAIVIATALRRTFIKAEIAGRARRIRAHTAGL